jgi:hypothetical protein
MIPEQHSDRLEAGALCFARLIGLLLGDPRQRPANRAPSTAGACNAEAGRRYLPWLEGREVIAVFEDRADPKPSYMMWLKWRDGRIGFIRDYRYVRYVAADAELALAPDAKPEGDGAAF